MFRAEGRVCLRGGRGETSRVVNQCTLAKGTTRMSASMSKILSNVCFVAGFLSIAASIAIWMFYNTSDSAHAERFGIFVGLWAPTFLILSDRLRPRAG